MQRDRLKRLAEKIDALSATDDLFIRRTLEMDRLRRQAAVQLHGICGEFVREINHLLSRSELLLDPQEYSQDAFRDDAVNLIQVNARGRIVQVEFRATPELTSTEDFRVPYTLQGAIRCFNQPLLERNLIEEQLLFYCLEKGRNLWRFFDARTYRTGPFDVDYLIGLMEQLV